MVEKRGILSTASSVLVSVPFGGLYDHVPAFLFAGGGNVSGHIDLFSVNKGMTTTSANFATAVAAVAAVASREGRTTGATNVSTTSSSMTTMDTTIITVTITTNR